MKNFNNSKDKEIDTNNLEKRETFKLDKLESFEKSMGLKAKVKTKSLSKDKIINNTLSILPKSCKKEIYNVVKLNTEFSSKNFCSLLKKDPSEKILMKYKYKEIVKGDLAPLKKNRSSLSIKLDPSVKEEEKVEGVKNIKPTIAPLN